MESWHFDRKKLNDAMTAAGMNMSQVAKAVWGTIKDSRGVEVARNRDRIRAYLEGSGATPDNFAKVATALGCEVDDLRATPPVKPTKLAPSAKSAQSTTITMPLPGGGTIEITVAIVAAPAKAR